MPNIDITIEYKASMNVLPRKKARFIECPYLLAKSKEFIENFSNTCPSTYGQEKCPDITNILLGINDITTKLNKKNINLSFVTIPISHSPSNVL